MAFVYINMTARLGNQMFQYWAGKWIADNLKRPLKIYIHEPFQVDRAIYPHLGEFEQVHHQYHIPFVSPENGYYTHTNSYDGSTIDVDGIIELHKNKNVPILLHFHVEDYSVLRPHEQWVKSIFRRSPDHELVCNNSLVVHLRLGDCAKENVAVNDDYIAFAVMIAFKENLPIIIVSEEIDHPCTLSMKTTLVEQGMSVTIASHTIDEYQKDFDTIASAKAIVATNSTFSWWPAFLNPFTPNVYIALSERQPQRQRNETLFRRDSPDSWKLWDMDAKKWI